MYFSNPFLREIFTKTSLAICHQICVSCKSWIYLLDTLKLIHVLIWERNSSNGMAESLALILLLCCKIFLFCCKHLFNINISSGFPMYCWFSLKYRWLLFIWCVYYTFWLYFFSWIGMLWIFLLDLRLYQ